MQMIEGTHSPISFLHAAESRSLPRRLAAKARRQERHVRRQPRPGVGAERVRSAPGEQRERGVPLQHGLPQ
eukprot:scaffold66_cov233-Pinguiococcus_pyrenoidosus.AAC.9